jgi:phosphatidylethanolamine-binding protein (PEBP) family uncharacterized protein
MFARRSPLRDPADRSQALAVGALAVLLALAGCGSSSATTQTKSDPSVGSTAKQTTPAATTAASPSTTASTAEKVPTEDITVKSSPSLKPMPARYTCDGANISPTFSWSAVPHGIKEVDLFVLSALPVHGKYVVAWAVTGISPSTHRLSSTHLPAGTVVGRNSSGQARYSLCPAHGTTGQYVALLYALPRRVPVSTGFDVEALVEGKLTHIATSEGELFFSYARR